MTDELRSHAVERLHKRRDFARHLLLYLLVNAFLVAIWAATGFGFFWPVFPIVGWGIAVLFNAWDLHQPEPPDEEQINREIARIMREGRR